MEKKKQEKNRVLYFMKSEPTCKREERGEKKKRTKKTKQLKPTNDRHGVV